MRTYILTVLLLIVTHPLYAGLRVGASRVDITPTFDTDMGGRYFQRFPTDIHDPLYVKTLVLDDGSTKLVIVAVDNNRVLKETTDYVRTEVEKRFGIPPQNVMLSATHTHSGPRMVQKYLAAVQPRIVDCIQMALARLEPAQVGVEEVDAPSLPKNRNMRRNMSREEIAQLEKTGTGELLDTSVPVMYFESLSGNPLAIYVNYSMHTVTVGSGTRISADYPYFMHEVFRKVFNKNIISLYTSGCAGDINAKFAQTYQPSFEMGMRIGELLAGKALHACALMTYTDDVKLKSSSVQVPIDLLPVTDEEIAWARSVNPKLFIKPVDDRSLVTQMWKAQKILDVEKYRKEEFTVEVQTFAIGNVGIVAMPNEIFVEYGLKIKENSPFEYTIVVELANDSRRYWYVPTAEAIRKGGYEVVQNRYAPDAGDKLVDEAVKSLKNLHTSM